MRYAILLFLTFTGLAVQAQTLVRITVVDALDERPIPAVDVQLPFGSIVRTDTAGVAALRTSKLPLRVELSHVAYGDTVLEITASTQLVRWTRHYFDLPAVEVHARPEVVFQRPDRHVADVHVNEHGLWVLTYERMRLLKMQDEQMADIFREPRLVLLDSMLNEVASCPVPGEAHGLHRDLRDRVLVETTTEAYGVRLIRQGDQQRIELQAFPLYELRNNVLPWSDSIPGGVLGTRPGSLVPAVEHIHHDAATGDVRTFCMVKDTFMMALFRSEYKYLDNRSKVDAMRMAAELGTDKETVAGYMRDFGRNIWYKPTYSPLFVCRDTVLIFDHALGRVLRYNNALQPQDFVQLGYSMEGPASSRVRGLVQDRGSGDVYTVVRHHRHTILSKFDHRTGKLGKQRMLTYPYVERLRVFNGYVYYIYRVNGSIQKRTLYREKL